MSFTLFQEYMELLSEESLRENPEMRVRLEQIIRERMYIPNDYYIFNPTHNDGKVYMKPMERREEIRYRDNLIGYLKDIVLDMRSRRPEQVIPRKPPVLYAGNGNSPLCKNPTYVAAQDCEKDELSIIDRRTAKTDDIFKCFNQTEQHTGLSTGTYDLVVMEFRILERGSKDARRLTKKYEEWATKNSTVLNVVPSDYLFGMDDESVIAFQFLKLENYINIEAEAMGYGTRHKQNKHKSIWERDVCENLMTTDIRDNCANGGVNLAEEECLASGEHNVKNDFIEEGRDLIDFNEDEDIQMALLFNRCKISRDTNEGKEGLLEFMKEREDFSDDELYFSDDEENDHKELTEQSCPQESHIENNGKYDGKFF